MSQTPTVSESSASRLVSELSVPQTCRLRRQLCGCHVAVMAFSLTCSGPFGVESIVRSGGVALTVFGLCVQPVVFSLPQILITAELGTMLPTDHGVVSWVFDAFGPVLGALNAWNYLVYLLVDLATYPVLVMSYWNRVHPQQASEDESGTLGWFLKAGIVALGAAINCMPIANVGNVLSLITVVVLLPFIVALPLAIDKGAAVDWTMPAVEYDPLQFMSVLIWLNTGWDSTASVIEEVHSPQAFFTGLVAACVACLACYLTSIFIGLAAGPGNWQDGYLSVAAQHLWYPLGNCVGVAAGIANLQLFTSELTTTACLIRALATDKQHQNSITVQSMNLLPRLLSCETSSGAPVAAVFCISAIIALLIVFDFALLVEFSTVSHCIGWLLQFMAFLRLRHSRAETSRPFKVPGGMLGACGLVSLVMPGVCFMLYLSMVGENCELIFGTLLAVNSVALCWHVVGRVRLRAQQR